MKRITISLEDDLYRIAKAYAISEDLSLSKAVTRLLRRGLERPTGPSVNEDGTTSSYQDREPRTGFPVRDFGRTITMGDVQRALDDEDLRILEQLGGGER